MLRSFRSLTCAFCFSLAAPLVVGCSKGAESAEVSWDDLRQDAQKSESHEEVASWLVAELLRPGGSVEQSTKARKRLDEIGAQGVLPSLARGLDSLGHGQSKRAAEEFFDALFAAKEWDDPRAPLYAWFAATRVQQLSGLVRDFGPRHRKQIAALLKEPGHIGFRAYATVVELWADDAFTEAESDVDAKLAQKLGCVSDISLAGPFGTESTSDILRSFPAERAGVWPEIFPTEAGQTSTPTSTPRRLKTDRIGCDVITDESTSQGVFYAQTFLELDEPKELILSASGSTALWVNDSLVLERDVRVWGIWPKFGVALQLPAGRHRVLWKVSDPSAALRVVGLDGKPAKVRTSTDDRAGYDLVPPEVGPDPNELMRYVRPDGVEDPADELTRFVAAHMAHQEGQADVASVLFEPFVEDTQTATGLALTTAAGYVADDPIYDETQSRDLVHELELLAAKRDPGLWYPRFRNIVWEAGQKGATTIVGELDKLAQEFPDVSAIRFTLAQLYENLDWGPEFEKTVTDLVTKFPNDEEAVTLGIDLFEAAGDTKKVDELLERLMHLNPDSEVLVARALNQRNYQAAIDELRRLEKRRSSRKDIADRVENILITAGDKEQTFEQLKKAVEKSPEDVHARLSLADAELARGDKNPLPQALVAAVQAGADPSLIEGAIDLMEGVTALEPYRLDGLAVIKDYEKSGQTLEGTAARILDYGAVWVQSDGSSRFLEHEIVRIQSEEAIKLFAETHTNGLTLHLRVIKKDGTIKEPEAVAGKPTATMPHLEIGDYVETERIISTWGDGVGDIYSGPGWFFREQNVAYHRSEFVVVAPAEKKLILETHNGVPDPHVERTGSLIVYRYRVDKSPAAPVEPNSPPEKEFLPRVSIGWGMDFDERIATVNKDMASLTANDPRIVRIAKNIVKGKKTTDQKLRALYHWVLDSVQDGEEADGRRVVVSRTGNRWRGFQTLCQALDIPVRWALAESRLSSPIVGPIGSAERPLYPLLVVGPKERRLWLTIDDKFAPFGTTPSHLRGEPAYILGGDRPETTKVPTTGSEDAIRYEGRGILEKNGSAKLKLRIVFVGAFATSLRNGLSQIPENQLGNIIESKLLGQHLQGARLHDFKVVDETELDKPLVIEVKTEVPQFATPSSMGLLLSPPFMPRLTGLTPLAARATPLLIQQETSQSLDLELELPAGMAAVSGPESQETDLSAYHIKDEVHPGKIRILREVSTRAGRIPVSQYASFQAYANQADAALGRAIRIK
jgi:tetratricopeptide (TPR) repeat protein